MKTANLNRLPRHQAQLSRTGHDMSQEFAFTASTGMILPVYQDYLNAGETDYFSGDLICRTQPLVTAAMCDVDIYLDWFFVPCQMLFTLFGSKRWMTNDLISSFYDDSVIDNDTFPLFDIESYLSLTTAQYGLDTDAWYGTGYDGDFECLGKSQFRLANHLGFNPYGIFYQNTDVSAQLQGHTNPNVFPLFALAYQAIYQDYFRLPLDSYERRSVSSFNVDSDYTATNTPVSFSAGAKKAELFCLRYRPRHLDYFTSIKASPLFSFMNSLGGNISPAAILNKVDNFLDAPGPPDPYKVQNSARTNVNSAVGTVAFATQVSAQQNPTTSFSTGQLRSLFAVEKLLRVIGRSKMDYDSQVLAHFGFKVPHDVKHELTHLKTQHTVLHINEITSTADTYNNGQGSALGAVGGQGYSIIRKPDKPFKFTAPVDGVIMCTFSAVPRIRYFGTFDRQNALTSRLSFYQPEFDKLGMQPLYYYEAAGFTTVAPNANRLGWQFRYYQWKRKFSRVSEAFAKPSVPGQINQNSAWVLSSRPFGTVNTSNWPSTGVGLSTVGLVCKPTDLNSIMIVPYQEGWDSSYLTNPQTMFYTDPFLCQFLATVKKVSTMSAFGEPDLNSI